MIKKYISSLVVGAVLVTSALTPFNTVSANNTNVVPTTVQENVNPVILNDMQTIPEVNAEKEIFIPQVNNGDEIRTNAAAVVGVYFIPGLGQVALLATGAIAFAGITYYAGSWVYETVMDFFADEVESEDDMTAQEIISKKRKGSIRSEFPSEFLDNTLKEIKKVAKKGDKNARKALKLLKDKRFEK